MTGVEHSPQPEGPSLLVPEHEPERLLELVQTLRTRNTQLALELEHVQNQLAAALERPAFRIGERRRATVLFADLRDSTALAESLAPEAMVGLLNTYLGTLARCVLARGGLVDKFLGDGLMAIFGVLSESGDGAVEAGHAAIEMRDAVRELNNARIHRGEMPIEFGVGIHTGEVVFGLVGMIGRSDYTAIGDTVNTAARLSGLCSSLGKGIVISEETAGRLNSVGLPLHELGLATLRGKTQPVTIFALS